MGDENGGTMVRQFCKREEYLYEKKSEFLAHKTEMEYLGWELVHDCPLHYEDDYTYFAEYIKQNELLKKELGI